MTNPDNPEPAIEDPMHGLSAVSDPSRIPAMPLGDGIYYQLDRFYAVGNGYIDSRGESVYCVGTWAGGVDVLRGELDLQEWVQAYQEGGHDALTRLEATRQQERLARTGLAHCFKPSDVCPGGKRLEDCKTGSQVFSGAQAWAEKKTKTVPPTNRSETTTLGLLGGICGSCALSCEVAVTLQNGEEKQTRVTFYKPDPNVWTMKPDSVIRGVTSYGEVQEALDELKLDNSDNSHEE